RVRRAARPGGPPGNPPAGRPRPPAGPAPRCGTLQRMCRSIKVLRRPDEPATTGEIEAAARQFVRKVSGYRTPSQRNIEAFDAAIEEVAAASRRLLEGIGATVEVGP